MIVYRPHCEDRLFLIDRTNFRTVNTNKKASILARVFGKSSFFSEELETHGS